METSSTSSGLTNALTPYPDLDHAMDMILDLELTRFHCTYFYFLYNWSFFCAISINYDVLYLIPVLLFIPCT